MTPLILKRAPIGPHQEEYDVLEDGRCRRLHLSHAHWTEGPPLDVDDPRQQGVLTDARLRADARGGDGGVRQELATGKSAAPISLGVGSSCPTKSSYTRGSFEFRVIQLSLTASGLIKLSSHLIFVTLPARSRSSV
jgi:hypothetical protein